MNRGSRTQCRGYAPGHARLNATVRLCFAAALAFAGCSTARDEAIASGARALPASELRATLPGSMLRGRDEAHGLNVCVYLPRDGVAVVSFETGAVSGRYRITDEGLLCVSGLPPGPGETCWEPYKRGEEYVLFDRDGGIALVAMRVQSQGGHFFR